MIFYILLLVLSVLVFLSKCKPDPIHGVYEQAGYLGPLKQLFMFIVILVYGQKKFENMLSYQDVSLVENSVVGVNSAKVFTYEEMELEFAVGFVD